MFNGIKLTLFVVFSAYACGLVTHYSVMWADKAERRYWRAKVGE